MKQIWFLAELIFHNTESESEKSKLQQAHKFDKQVRLFKAANVREAYQSALVLASKELDLRNGDNDHHQWEFAAIGILQTLEQPEHGIDKIELHYTLENDSDANLHIISLRLRQNSLQNQIALSV